MKRSLVSVAGAVVVASVALVTWFLGPSTVGPTGRIQLGLVTAAGLLGVVAGVVDGVGPVRWHHLVGLGHLSFAAAQLYPAPGALSAGDPTGLSTGLLAVGSGLFVAALGVNWLLAGRYYELAMLENASG
ncbi:MAG: hypothetical protein V5A23_08495 [Halobacteriales archaeon]